MKVLLARGLQYIYRHSDTAYASMDMYGLGYIDVSTFASSIAAQRVI